MQRSASDVVFITNRTDLQVGTRNNENPDVEMAQCDENTRILEEERTSLVMRHICPWTCHSHNRPDNGGPPSIQDTDISHVRTYDCMGFWRGADSELVFRAPLRPVPGQKSRYEKNIRVHIRDVWAVS